MTLSPLSGPGPLASAPKPTESFTQVLKGQLENAPQRLQSPPIAAPGKCRVEGTSAPAPSATRVLAQLDQAQGRMDEILRLAESGKSFSPAELLSLQTHVYRASQELDLAGKVVEKATGGVKQVLQTQV